MIISEAKYKHYLTTFERIAACRCDLAMLKNLVRPCDYNKLANYLAILEWQYVPKYHSKGASASIGMAIESAAFLTTVGVTVPRTKLILCKIATLTSTDRIKFGHKYVSPPDIPICRATIDRYPQPPTVAGVSALHKNLTLLERWMRALFGAHRTHKRYSLDLEELGVIADTYEEVRSDLEHMDSLAFVAAHRIFGLILNSDRQPVDRLN